MGADPSIDCPVEYDLGLLINPTKKLFAALGTVMQSQSRLSCPCVNPFGAVVAIFIGNLYAARHKGENGRQKLLSCTFVLHIMRPIRLAIAYQ